MYFDAGRLLVSLWTLFLAPSVSSCSLVQARWLQLREAFAFRGRYTPHISLILVFLLHLQLGITFVSVFPAGSTAAVKKTHSCKSQFVVLLSGECWFWLDVVISEYRAVVPD